MVWWLICSIDSLGNFEEQYNIDFINELNGATFVYWLLREDKFIYAINQYLMRIDTSVLF